MEREIISILFSCDRALQLDGALRSFLLHCQDAARIKVFILYKTTNRLHAKQYKLLSEEYKEKTNFHFIEQRNFYLDVLRLLANGELDRYRGYIQAQILKLGSRSPILRLFPSSARQVLFLVDDNIFVRSFRLLEVYQNLQDCQDALGFSLRLGENIQYCYTTDCDQQAPSLFPLSDHARKFRWVDAENDWGYPLELSSSIYRVSDILPLLIKSNFTNPNVLETQLASQKYQFEKKKPYLLCYDQSVAFANPINKVQQKYNNRSGNIKIYSSESMAKMFEGGNRLDIQQFSGFKPISCHQEVDLSFIPKSLPDQVG